MPKLRQLSGKEVISFFEQKGFIVCRQKGSHVNMSRIVSERKQVLTILNHKEINRGTLHEIFKQASHFVLESELREYFYTE